MNIDTAHDQRSDRQVSRVLLIEDNPGDVLLTRTMLGEAAGYEYRVVTASTIAEAKERITSTEFDAVLLDMSLPDSEGLNNLRELKSCSPQLPVVVMTGRKDEDFALATLREGAQDYIIKGELDSRQLTRALKYSIERKRLEDQMTYLAHHDQLTGLANRVLFRDRLTQALNRTTRTSESFALLYLDLDHFKSINDALGHDVGDLLLLEVSRRLTETVRGIDTVARLGGDEFAVIVGLLKSTKCAVIVAEKIITSLAEPFNLNNHMLHVGTSIGIAVYPSCGENEESLIKNADSAMYRAKNAGRNNYSIYTNDMNASALDHFNMANRLHSAIESEEFVLHYQPKVDLRTGKIVGTEALVRWQHPGKGIIPPAKFIPLLEENGLITELGKWVLATACAQNRQWHRDQVDTGKVAVNLSGVQLLQRDFSMMVADILQETGLHPSLLEVELTEDFFISNTKICTDILGSLRELGVSIAVDDFGTGYSSFNYLKNFLVNTVKIDRSFVNNVASNKTDAAITSAIISMSRDMGINVIAEGVENNEQLDFLADREIDEIQGFLISPPLPDKLLANLVGSGAGILFGSHCDDKMVTGGGLTSAA